MPLTYHVAHTGDVDLRCLVIASSEQDPDEIACSTLSRPFTSRPSVTVSASTMPSRRRLGQHILTVKVHNSSDAAIQVNGLSVYSQAWRSADVDP